MATNHSGTVCADRTERQGVKSPIGVPNDVDVYECQGGKKERRCRKCHSSIPDGFDECLFCPTAPY